MQQCIWYRWSWYCVGWIFGVGLVRFEFGILSLSGHGVQYLLVALFKIIRYKMNYVYEVEVCLQKKNGKYFIFSRPHRQQMNILNETASNERKPRAREREKKRPETTKYIHPTISGFLSFSITPALTDVFWCRFHFYSFTLEYSLYALHPGVSLTCVRLTFTLQSFLAPPKRSSRK